jgi:hypothetical protein
MLRKVQIDLLQVLVDAFSGQGVSGNICETLTTYETGDVRIRTMLLCRLEILLY